MAKSGDWPGPQCIAALTIGEILRGTWFDRSAEFVARQRGSVGGTRSNIYVSDIHM